MPTFTPAQVFSTTQGSYQPYFNSNVKDYYIDTTPGPTSFQFIQSVNVQPGNNYIAAAFLSETDFTYNFETLVFSKKGLPPTLTLPYNSWLPGTSSPLGAQLYLPNQSYGGLQPSYGNNRPLVKFCIYDKNYGGLTTIVEAFPILFDCDTVTYNLNLTLYSTNPTMVGLAAFSL